MKTLKIFIATILLLFAVSSYGQVSSYKTLQKGNIVTYMEVFPWSFLELTKDEDVYVYFNIDFTDARYPALKPIESLYLHDKCEFIQFIDDLKMLVETESTEKVIVTRPLYKLSTIKNSIAIVNTDDAYFFLKKTQVKAFIEQIVVFADLLKEYHQ
jgi:hypothetical protein